MMMMIYGLLGTKIGSCPSLVREDNNNKIIIIRKQLYNNNTL